MTRTLMITVSVAALIAGGGMAAFAQGANAPRDQPAAAVPVQNGKSDSPKAETPRKTEAVKPAQSAQLPAKPTGAKSETSGQGNTMQPAQHDAVPSSERFAPKAEVPKGPAQADAQHGAPAALSAEHHAKVWEAIRGEKAAPFTGARFSMTVGEAVPQAVRLNRLPTRVIEFAPQYRGYEYLLVGDEILIVDPRTHRIVAVIAA